jgi:hypothetical protein
MPEECQGEAKNKKPDKLSFVGLSGFSPPPPLLQPIRLFRIIN